MGVDRSYGSGTVRRVNSTPIDTTSYMQINKQAVSNLTPDQARQRAESFKRVAGPLAGVGAATAIAVGGTLGAPFAPIAAVAAPLFYASSELHKGKLKSESKAGVKRTAPASMKVRQNPKAKKPRVTAK